MSIEYTEVPMAILWKRLRRLQRWVPGAPAPTPARIDRMAVSAAAGLPVSPYEVVALRRIATRYRLESVAETEMVVVSRGTATETDVEVVMAAHRSRIPAVAFAFARQHLSVGRISSAGVEVLAALARSGRPFTRADAPAMRRVALGVGCAEALLVGITVEAVR